MDGHFPTPSGRGQFSVLEPSSPGEGGDGDDGGDELEPGTFVAVTRRGKQFNSMVHGAVDPLTGAERDAVLIDQDDAASLGLSDGDRVRLRSATGSLDGTVRTVRLAPGTVQVHWPEGNALVAAGEAHREPGSKVPDYNALVTLEPLGP